MTTVQIPIWLQIVFTLFIIGSPVFAVWLGIKLQNRKEKRDHLYRNRFSVFATIIGERHASGFSRFFITAINQVPMVFNKNEKVLSAYTKFIEEHGKKEFKREVTLQCLNDLIVEMGKDLGYSEMNNTWISSFFYPDAAWADFEARHQQNLKYLRENSPTPATQQEEKKA